MERLPSTSKSKETLRVVCISDTHSLQKKIRIPDGDILIHAGDFTNNSLPEEVKEFNTWLKSLPHKHKIVIAGNHEITFDKENYEKALRELYHDKLKEKLKPEEQKAILDGCTYLEDAEIIIEGYKFYGSPWIPMSYLSGFSLENEKELLSKWKKIPDGTEILITHTPPYGILDLTAYDKWNVGCKFLAAEVLERVRPLYHIFGHIHEGHGQIQKENTTFINAAICDHRYKPINTPIVFDLPRKSKPMSM